MKTFGSECHDDPALNTFCVVRKGPSLKCISIFGFVLFCANVLGISFSMAKEPNPFIRDGSIGIVPDESKPDESKRCAKSGFTYRPITCWPGEKFLFLPQFKRDQKYGYQSFYDGGGRGKHGQPTYEEAVGRIGTVLDVTKRFMGDMRSGWQVTIRMDDNGQEYTAHASMDDPDAATIHAIAPLLDLQAARNKWLGKTLWLKRPNLLYTYDEATDKLEKLSVPGASRVKVTDVVAGWFADTPILFIVRTDSGAEGFVSVNLSGTNVSKVLRKFNWHWKFGGTFFERDPGEIFNWSNRVWIAIASQSVFVGMKEDQARLSWGKPKDVHRTVVSGKTSEQWVYTEGNLYFENGTLTSIKQ